MFLLYNLDKQIVITLLTTTINIVVKALEATLACCLNSLIETEMMSITYNLCNIDVQ